MKNTASTVVLNNNTVEQRATKSAQKLLLSPTNCSKISKQAPNKTQRLQTYNSFKLGSNSAIKANPSKHQSKFELPMLNHRSSSKQNLVFTNSSSNTKLRESHSTGGMNIIPNMHQTQSYNFLPAKQVVNGAIQTLSVNCTPSQSVSSSKQPSGLPTSKAQQMASVARLYQSQGITNGSLKESSAAVNSTGYAGGPSAPKISQNKSPGKSFKRVGS